jgi:hypothetical protein
MSESQKVHESIEVAKLDAAKFVIAQFNPVGVAVAGEKPKVYDAAIAYIEKALQADA